MAETLLETWDTMMALNAHSAFLVSQAVVPTMTAQGHGRIIHIGSWASLKGSAGVAAHAASKAALLWLTEALAAEVAATGITVNAVPPGTLDTPVNRATMPQAEHTRWVTLAAVAVAVLFLASDAAGAINGATIPVYGRS